MVMMGKSYRILIETPVGKKVIGKTICRCENSIKIVLQDTVCGLD
jgi:hypothetical protein